MGPFLSRKSTANWKNHLLQPARLKWLLALLIAGIPAAGIPGASARAAASDRVRAHQPAPLAESVILSDPADAYYPLAQEIAQAEALPVAHRWEDALAYNPAYVLWVAAPSSLTDQVMAAAGQALKTQDALPAVGVITGDILAQARDLWQRGAALRSEPPAAGQVYAANAEFPTARIHTARLVDVSAQPPQLTELTTANLAHALTRADYLSFTGHGASGYLRLDENTQFMPGDLPALPGSVISTASCQTFRLWKDGSIALAFARQGAAAYAGFVFSPLEGYLVGEFSHQPFRFSWPDFPIGRVAALQTRGTLQGFASVPHYYILGDPRIALQPAAPFELASEETQGETRVLTYRGAPAGLIPVRVPAAGDYQFVEVVGLSTAADGDPFFNARLQIASLQGDKYILFTHSGGDFTLRLRKSQPWLRPLTRPLVDALDHAVLFTPMNGGGAIIVAAGVVLLAALAFRLWKRPVPVETLRPAGLLALGIGLATALALGLYQLVRLPHASITTKPLAFEPLWLAGVFLVTACSALLYFLAGSRRARILALLAAAFPAWLPGIGVLAIVTVTNLLISQQIGIGIYNLNLGWLPLIATAVWIIAVGLVIVSAGRLFLRKQPL